MDDISRRILEKVHPKQRELVSLLIQKMISLGIDARVTQGLRTAEEQQKLYNQGRTSPGRRVTNAKPFQSNHNFGLANDITIYKFGKPDWNDLEPYKTLGREAEKLGLEWGGRWKAVDMPHVQLKGMSVKECQVFYRRGGIQAVWQRMSEILGGAPNLVFIPKADELLEFGDKGTEVGKLQQQLVRLNFLRPHEVDEQFGKVTKNAVISFQRQNGLTADGIVGPCTKAKIKAAVEKASELTPENVGVKIDYLTNSAVVTVTENPAKISQSENSDEPAAENHVSENGSNQNTANEQPPINNSSDSSVGEVTKTETEKTDAEGNTETESSVSQSVKTFDAKTIPAFIPRFGKQWFLSVIPGAGLISTIAAKLSAMPDWLVFTLGFFTGITTVLFVQMLIKHREMVISFITKCYEITANPEMHNLIPTNADAFVGQRQETILSSLAPASASPQ